MFCSGSSENGKTGFQTTFFLLLIADFGVDQGVEDVEYGVEDDGQYADEDGQPQDHAVVAVERAVDEELSDAGQTEDAFDNDGAGDDTNEGGNEIGEDGQHGGTQGVAQDDAVHRQPFGACGADVGAVQHFYHRAARDAGEACDIAYGEGGDGQDEAGQRAVIPATGGQPFEGNGEDENHDGGFDEHAYCWICKRLQRDIKRIKTKQFEIGLLTDFQTTSKRKKVV